MTGLTITTDSTHIEITRDDDKSFFRCLYTRLIDIDALSLNQDDSCVEIYFKHIDHPVMVMKSELVDFDSTTTFVDNEAIYTLLKALI